MPTENSEVIPGKVFVQIEEDDAIDAMKYGVEGMTSGKISMTIEIPEEKVKQILKMHGLNKITRKRFKKLLMGCRIQRNEAEIIANEFCKNKIQYTPLAVQKVVETIMIEAEKC